MLCTDGTDMVPALYQQSYDLDEIAMNAGFVNLTSLRFNPHAKLRIGFGCRMSLYTPYTLQSPQHLTAAASGGTRCLLCYFLHQRMLCSKVCRSRTQLAMCPMFLTQCKGSLDHHRHACCSCRLLRRLVLARLIVSAHGLADALAGLPNLQVRVPGNLLCQPLYTFVQMTQCQTGTLFCILAAL